jgi:hypothetical protein
VCNNELYSLLDFIDHSGTCFWCNFYYFALNSCFKFLDICRSRGIHTVFQISPYKENNITNSLKASVFSCSQVANAMLLSMSVCSDAALCKLYMELASNHISAFCRCLMHLWSCQYLPVLFYSAYVVSYQMQI